MLGAAGPDSRTELCACAGSSAPQGASLVPRALCAPSPPQTGPWTQEAPTARLTEVGHGAMTTRPLQAPRPAARKLLWLLPPRLAWEQLWETGDATALISWIYSLLCGFIKRCGWSSSLSGSSRRAAARRDSSDALPPAGRSGDPGPPGASGARRSPAGARTAGTHPPDRGIYNPSLTSRSATKGWKLSP